MRSEKIPSAHGAFFDESLDVLTEAVSRVCSARIDAALEDARFAEIAPEAALANIVVALGVAAGEAVRQVADGLADAGVENGREESVRVFRKAFAVALRGDAGTVKGVTSERVFSHAGEA